MLVEIFWTRTGLLVLFLLVTAGVALPLAGVAEPGTVRNLLVAVGTGGVVTAFVTTAQTLLTASSSQRVVVDALVRESRSAMRELTDEYRATNSEFFPTHVFDATDLPDPTFNRLLMADLQTARQYLFRGFSARHAAARLMLTKSVERELRVVIADPRDRASVTGRAAYLVRRGAQAESHTDLCARLHAEIRIGLVGLWVVRGRCSRIDVTATASPPVDRFELFDNSIWVSLFSGVGGATTPFPRTLRFDRSSFIYAMEHSEFVRVSTSRSATHASLRPDTDREEFLALYEKLTGQRLTPRRLSVMEDAFLAFQDEFVATADLDG